MKCCDITVGMLNRRISIERLAVTADTLGGFTETWQPLSQPWAHIKPMSGRELIHADQISALAVSRFVIRYNRYLVESDRVLYRGVYYNIRSLVNIDEADEYTEITAERGVAQ
jgi:SPP1 family predicted phage head-tail adaptor